ncbi:hypothetical protein CH255_19750 [Rhodococcus sp. 05-2255-2A2]|uniref:hypothetical protein n=1 Tax=unclassified Rhodococcus (in: high G+C Gram-positive bacteria) TaxID=192944 RepID=UPI000B9BA8F6|nr:MULTISPECIES: hypothetical protein [unclassified Rhodococcus (in: high G+C Gram-positive bacteria)]OZE03884.1 hypothetical protein CH250_22600 [Rhodococcus sp. 05-2255-3C]OZE17037.1 hypothetical protein CH255_19750 [Rhodococcus sp. 05-2255-2A2]
MILPVLVLGAGRYLDVSGRVLPPERTYSAAEIAAHSVWDPGFDPEIAGAPGEPEVLAPERRAYWESVAARGGHSLRELLAST